MSGVDRIVKGERWCLRSIELPHGMLQQVSAWLSADPRPNARVMIVETPTADEVWFMPESGRETFRLATLDFTARYQPIGGDPPTPEQVPPERPPVSHEEMIQRRLAGW